MTSSAPARSGRAGGTACSVPNSAMLWETSSAISAPCYFLGFRHRNAANARVPQPGGFAAPGSAFDGTQRDAAHEEALQSGHHDEDGNRAERAHGRDLRPEV